MSNQTDEELMASFSPKDTSLVKNQWTQVICAMCNREREQCTCHSCFYCGESFISAVNHKLIVGRHFCRSCFKPCCRECRDETKNRWNPRFDCEKEIIRYCKRCTPLTALGAVLVEELHRHEEDNTSGDAATTESVWQANPKRGLMLLFDAMDCPRRCIDIQACGNMTNESTCASCHLPTVSLKPFVEKLPAVKPLPETPLHIRCLKAEMNLDEEVLDQRFAPENKEALQKLEDSIFDQKSFWDPPQELPAHDYRDIVLSCLAASISYEYNHYPRMVLNATDMSAARLLRPIEVHASFSIFEASGDRIIIAFPGTHDTRTIMTDLNASRTVVHELTKINNGVVSSESGSATSKQSSASTVSGGVSTLHHYRVHNGFLRASTLIENRLPTSRIKQFIDQGKRIIFSGHSLGCAIASLTLLRVLRRYPEWAHQTKEVEIETNSDSPRKVSYPIVQCIDFGTPLIGNTALKNRIHRAGLAKLYLHVVHRKDIVPRFLTVGRTQEQVMVSVKAKVHEVTTKIAEAGSSFVKKISSFFSKSEDSVLDDATSKSGGKETEKNSKKNLTALDNITKEHPEKHSPIDEKSKIKKSHPSPHALTHNNAFKDPEAQLHKAATENNNTNKNDRIPSRAETMFGNFFSNTSGKMKREPTATAESPASNNDNDVEPSSTVETSSPSASPSTNAARSTFENVNALDLDSDDMHTMMASCENLGELEVEAESTACTTSTKQTTSSSPSSTYHARKPSSPDGCAPQKANHQFHQTAQVLVQSAYDTFGRYLFLDPTPEQFAISSPISAKQTSTKNLDDFPSPEEAAKELQYSAMRVNVMLVENPAESFGVLQNTSGSWLQGVNDHLLDGYQRSLMMACFKG